MTDIDKVKSALETLGARFALSVIAALEEKLERMQAVQEDTVVSAEKLKSTMEERLKQAMKREAELQKENEHLKRETARLQGEVERMEDHPEVREAKRKRAEKQVEELKQQIAALSKPEKETLTESKSTKPKK